jgi:hypothetical protein
MVPLSSSKSFKDRLEEFFAALRYIWPFSVEGREMPGREKRSTYRWD